MRTALAIDSRIFTSRGSAAAATCRLGVAASSTVGGCSASVRPAAARASRDFRRASSVSERSLKSVPEVARVIAWPSAALSAVNGCASPRRVLIEKTATCVRASSPLSTKSRADVSARRLSSRLMRSKTSVTRLSGDRRPSAGAAPAAGGSTGAAAAATAPAPTASSVPSVSTSRNDRISQRWSFSRTWISSAVRSRTGRPFLSRAITSRSTTAVPVRNSGVACVAGGGAVCPRARATERTRAERSESAHRDTPPSRRLRECTPPAVPARAFGVRS